MRCIGFLFLFLVLGYLAEAGQKMEVFTLENRDAESLVPVIASTLGPEARVTADARTNSLIVAYPEEMEESLKMIIRQLDELAENIQVDVVTMDVETVFLEHLGLTARSGLGPGDYAKVLPLLIEDQRATLIGHQSVTTQANQPAQISLTDGVVRHSGHHEHASVRRVSTALAVTPRLLGDDMIELKFAQVSPSLVDGQPIQVGRVFSTIVLPDGAAHQFRFNKEYNVDNENEIPILPIGASRSAEGRLLRIVLISAKIIDYQADGMDYSD